MITVMGATGNTGGAIVQQIMAAGQPVRAIGRSATNLAPLVRAGAETRVGDAADAGFLTAAFRGADAVYTLLPYDPRASGYVARANAMGEAITTAIRDAGVPHVVMLSSVGADRPAGTGFIASLHDQEHRLRTIADINLLILRPGSFFENFAGAFDLIVHQGINGDSVDPDVQIPMVATRDIAAAASRALLARDWSGVVVRELLGPRDLSYAEATRILGAQLGQPNLPYVRIPDAEMIQVLEQAGFAADFAHLHVELNRALNDGTIRSRDGRTAANTTPTRFEGFSAELANQFNANQSEHLDQTG